MNTISSIFWSFFVLIIWFKTTAFIEYAKLFNFKKMFKIDEYEKYKERMPNIDYTDFLVLKYPNFITKLIQCPFCINFWICLLLVIIYRNLILFPIIYSGGIILYFLFEVYIWKKLKN
jgi:hypothetical protein